MNGYSLQHPALSTEILPNVSLTQRELKSSQVSLHSLLSSDSK